MPTAAWKKKRTGIAWQEGETLSVAIGQGFNLATPLQMAMFTAAVANGGKRYQPRLVRKIVIPEVAQPSDQPPQLVGRLPVSDDVMHLVKRGMWEVVQGERGTARIARLKQVDISGKTGTAQVIRLQEGVDSDELAPNLRHHAWFVGWAPIDQPQIVIALVVEHGGGGGSVAAPVASKIFSAALSQRRNPEAVTASAKPSHPRSTTTRENSELAE